MFSHGCGIPDYDSIVLTGGDDDRNGDGYGVQLSSVQRYDLNGLVEDLPSLNQAREGHGCGFYNKDGTKVNHEVAFFFIELQVQVFLVAGGVVGVAGAFNPDLPDGGFLSSTEIWIPGWDSWKYADPLPEPVAGAAHVSLYNNIYLLGNDVFCIIIISLISQEISP